MKLIHHSKLFIIIVILVALVSCVPQTQAIFAGNHSSQLLVDSGATLETQAVYRRIQGTANQSLLFGHHDAFLYGLEGGGWNKIYNESKQQRGDHSQGFSDVGSLCGQNPALFSWDLYLLPGKKGEFSYEDGIVINNVIDNAVFKKEIIESYLRGGINSCCWHMINPVTLGGYNDLSGDFSLLFVEGEVRDRYFRWLEGAALFFKSLKADKNKDGVSEAIPLFFRPFHEMNGNWFWWGAKSLSTEQFKQLWKMTIDYLIAKEVHNLIYIYAPDRFHSLSSYLKFYPGNDYVDVFGHDNYYDIELDNRNIKRQLKVLHSLSQVTGKPAALTEIGEPGLGLLSDPNWWSESLLPILRDTEYGRNIAWVVLWRNASIDHYFTPYQNHPFAQDFIDFYADPYTLFERDIGQMNYYQ